MKIYCRWLLSCAAIALFTLTVQTVKATPYACEVTNVAGNVQFYLGESADDVTVIFDDGAATNDLGALAAGANLFALGSHTNYSIIVAKVGSGAFHQISVDATNNSFYGPRGVTVNRNPGKSYFGRVYVVNASAGTGGAPGQTVGRGVYVLNADTTTCLGYGSAAQVPTGMTLGGSTSYSPYKPFVGPDDTVYIGNADGTAISVNPPGNAIVWAVDPNLTSASVLFETNSQLGPGASVISTPFVTGSLGAGNLQLYCNLWGYGATNTDLGIPLYTYIYSFSMGGGPIPWTSAPQTNADVGGDALNNVDGIVGDVYMAPDGKFFASQNRNAATGGAAAGSVSLWVFANDAKTYLWDSSSANGGNDPFAADGRGSGGLYGIAVSPDDKYVAGVNGFTGDVLICSLTNGLPDMSTIATNVTSLGGTTRGIAFDAADNIYVASGGADRLRVYSIGLTTTATTYNDITGTNGTFTLSLPNIMVSVVAITNQASQSGPTPGVFQITRTGGNISQPLSVSFAFGGTATASTYTVSPAGLVPGGANMITIAAGMTSTNITITPVVDSVSRPTTTVTLSVHGTAFYSAVSPSSDTVSIQNTGPQLVFVSGVSAPSMYKAFSNDYASFTVTRWGNTNVSAYVASGFTFGGTAVEGTDFTGANGAAPSVTINPGDVSDTVLLYPLVNGMPPVDTNVVIYTGNKTIVAGYSGTTNTATLTIIDNGNPVATYLYSDPLNDVTDSNNWVVTSVNDNMQTNAIDDSIVFGYDLFDNPLDPVFLEDLGVTPLSFPPSGATNALRMSVNKLYSEYNSAGGSPVGNGMGAAGAVNMYLTNAFFSGNFAIRFNMNLMEGFDSLYTTEGALFGFNHGGQATNWFAGSGIRSGWGANNSEVWGSDGIWCWVSTDDGLGTFDNLPSDYVVLTGVAAFPNTGFLLPPLASVSKSTVVNNFKSAVFTAPQGPGLISNESPDDAADSLTDDSAWSDVELKQFNNIVTISIDKTPICVFTNTTSFTNGYLMLGYEDPYDSVGGGDAAVYYSNLRVVQLTPPLISETALSSGVYVFDFTSTDGDATAATFKVVGATSLNGPYTVVSGVTITQMGNGAYQASVPTSGAIHFYRIQQIL
jgi:hypothetical protein